MNRHKNTIRNPNEIINIFNVLNCFFVFYFCITLFNILLSFNPNTNVNKAPKKPNDILIVLRMTFKKLNCSSLHTVVFIYNKREKIEEN